MGSPGWYLGTFLLLGLVGGAPGIEWVGPRMLLNTPQCPGRPHSRDGLAVSVSSTRAERPLSHGEELCFLLLLSQRAHPSFLKNNTSTVPTPDLLSFLSQSSSSSLLFSGPLRGMQYMGLSIPGTSLVPGQPGVLLPDTCSLACVHQSEQGFATHDPSPRWKH